jgi:hypothetical protein
VEAEPLHVQVARALGWSDIENLGPREYGPEWHRPGADLWMGHPPTQQVDEYIDLPPYGEASIHGQRETGFLMGAVFAAYTDLRVSREYNADGNTLYFARISHKLQAEGASMEEAVARLFVAIIKHLKGE